ncbi:MAG: tRNA pseudouridine(55) synthase TruB [Treponema sp.]|jgi:tRNA pseudouridine55 synthase|nr:tRNA pseudouridine(55) synthase TruB [Treponema sp.]
MRGTDGILLLNKRPGLTSFEALAQIKRALGTGKVGHTGTLDKFASGLLLVLVGRAVKLASWFDYSDKVYEGTIKFGQETDTLDPEGTVVVEAPVPSQEALEAVLPKFWGNIMQAPPVYSAVHVEGRRAHELVRSGEAVVMKERPVTIHSLELLSWEPPLAKIRVRCSKGTYIRSLARDVAMAAGSRGHLVQLCRTVVASFTLAEALNLATPGADSANTAAIAAALRPLDVAVFAALGIPGMAADEETARAMIQGKPLGSLLGRLTPLPGETLTGDVFSIAVFDQAGGLVALLNRQEQGSGWSYGYVYGSVQ